MAFPSIPTVAGGRVLSALATNPAGTHTSPSLTGLTKNAGDLLIAIVILYDGNSTNAEFSSWGGGFTELPVGGDNAGTATMAIGVAYKFSTGSETGTFTVTSVDASANDSAFFLLSIAGAHASTAPEAGGFATGTAPDSGALDPGAWAAEDTLWIAVGGSGETSLTGSYTGIGTAPANYTDQADSGISADAVGGVEGSVAFRQLNAASEDPGAWSMDTSNARGASLLIAVRPAAAEVHEGSATLTGGGVVTPSGVMRALSSQTLTGGGVEAHTAVKQALAAQSATGGGVATSTSFSAHTGSHTVTGGGVATPVWSGAHFAAESATGGGSATPQVVKQGLSSQSLAASGSVTASQATARAAAETATGAGTASAAQTTARVGSQTGTGGGSVVPGPAGSHFGTASATGGGVATQSGQKNAQNAQQVTASGAATAAQTTARASSQTLTGGGVVTYSYSTGGGGEQHFGDAVITGGGTVVPATVKRGLATEFGTGAGQVQASGQHGALASPVLTGAGAVTWSQLTARALAAILTGGGVVTAQGEASGGEVESGPVVLTGGGTVTVAARMDSVTQLINHALSVNNNDPELAAEWLLQLAVKRRQFPRGGDPVRAELGKNASTGIAVAACVRLGVAGQVLDTLREVTRV